MKTFSPGDAVRIRHDSILDKHEAVVIEQLGDNVYLAVGGFPRPCPIREVLPVDAVHFWDASDVAA